MEAPTILPMFPAYFIFNSLLVLLLLLHIAWTYLILLIVKSSLKSGQVRVLLSFEWVGLVHERFELLTVEFCCAPSDMRFPLSLCPLS